MSIGWRFLVMIFLFWMVVSRFDAVESELGIKCHMAPRWSDPLYFTCEEKEITMADFAREMQIKQFVAVMQGRWCKFMVFKTGSEKHYLFSALDRYGCQTGLMFPVLKSELRRDVRHALANGRGNASL